MSLSPAQRRSVIRGIKLVLLAGVLAAVCWQAWKLGRGIDWSQVTIHPGWLVLSVLFYVLGWWPAVRFWRELLHDAGTPIDAWSAARAYYCSHLGKYIPGKAGVVFIRAGLVHALGVPIFTGALAAAFETLASMAAGALVGAALLPAIVPWTQWLGWWGDPEVARVMRWAVPVGVLTAGLIGLPVMSRLFNLILRRMAREENSAQAAWSRQPTWTSFCWLIAGWWLHGLSLGCTLQCVSPLGVDWWDWPRWTAATALSIVLGFLAIFAPGGLGVREWILLELLQEDLGPLALIATVLSRLVWLAGELGAAAILYYYWPTRPATPPKA